MTDALTTIASDQKDALQLVELVERFIACGDMYSDNALELAQDHLLSRTTKGANAQEAYLILAASNFLSTQMGD
jgi:hypothetical protein